MAGHGKLLRAHIPPFFQRVPFLFALTNKLCRRLGTAGTTEQEGLDA